MLRKVINLSGFHGGLAGANALENITVRHKSDTLPPGAIVRCEMFVDIVIGTKKCAHCA